MVYRACGCLCVRCCGTAQCASRIAWIQVARDADADPQSQAMIRHAGSHAGMPTVHQSYCYRHPLCALQLSDHQWTHPWLLLDPAYTGDIADYLQLTLVERSPGP
jgi:hypothetical protein